jgi:hypothetical protein
MKNPWSQFKDGIKVRRDEWTLVLEAKVKKWSAMSYAEIMSRLPDGECYEVEVDSKKYQLEVELLEDTERYIHVEISVDDGSIPASFRPVSSSFIRKKQVRGE